METGMNLVGALDQGTSSSRFLIFEANSAKLICSYQIEIEQLTPREGWLEQDPNEILQSCYTCIASAVEKLKTQKIDLCCIKGIGITNQRETTIIWDKTTGQPLHNAIVWCDARTKETVTKLIDKSASKSQDCLKTKCGLPISTYFSAVKVRWLLDNVPKIKVAVDEGRALFGTVDSWLLWNMTGGVNGGVHVTDITNASRTMVYNIYDQKWDKELCDFFEIPMSILPKVCSSSEIYGKMTMSHLAGTPICGCLGDQQAALVGQRCFVPGDIKNTYGTGCFLLQNTGLSAVNSVHGLLTTVAYKLGENEETHYALEGSIAVAGGVVRWLRDNLGIIEKSSDIEKLASSVENSGGSYFVPAFSGLYAPYWKTDARGVICGLSQNTNKSHIAYAALEAVCFQTREITEAMQKDASMVPGAPTKITSLQVDGGMTNNNLLMQLQSDVLQCNVYKPEMVETTALGAAMAAGKAVGIWNFRRKDLEAVKFKQFSPKENSTSVNKRFAQWKIAVQKSMDWFGNSEEQQ